MKAVYLCDDTEILGSGFGSVADLIRKPVEKYVSILNEHQFVGTFFVDMAHYIFLLENKQNHINDFLDFKETIEFLFSRGMNVQLHLHPQWMKAICSKEKTLDNRWNIGLLSSEEIEKLVKNSINILTKIGQKFDSEYRPTVFKAGSWGLQPFEVVFPILSRYGITKIIGISGNIVIPSQHVDYSNFRNRKNTIKIHSIDVLLMNMLELNVLDVFLYKFAHMTSKKGNLINRKFIESSALSDIKLFYRSGTKMFTHLRWNWHPAWLIKMHLKKVLSDSESEYMYVETHTKDFNEDILTVISYLSKARAKGKIEISVP